MMYHRALVTMQFIIRTNLKCWSSVRVNPYGTKLVRTTLKMPVEVYH